MSPYTYSGRGEEKAAPAAAWSEYESGILLVKDHSGIVTGSYKSTPVAAFADLFDRLLRAEGWSSHRFALASGTSQASVYKASKGKIPPPLEHLPKWANALRLTGHERDAFIAAGRQAKAMAKAETREDVAAVYDRIEELESVLGSIFEVLDECRAKLPRQASEAIDALRREFER